MKMYIQQEARERLFENGVEIPSRQIRYYGNTYVGAVLAHGAKRAWVRFYTAAGVKKIKQVKIVRDQTTFNQAGYGAVLLPQEEGK